MPIFIDMLTSPTRSIIFLICVLTCIAMANAGNHTARSEPILPLQVNTQLDPQKIRLGDELFHDVRLSKDNSKSCAHCHNLATNGSDGLSASVGINGAVGTIKAPTVYNSGLNFVQFWNGRVNSLEEQAGGPITNPIEMGSSWPEVIQKLSLDTALLTSFLQIYEEGITENNIRDALATFERSLITANSPFDRWLLGDDDAISMTELNGYQLFKKYGCTSCHQGAGAGGNMYGYMGAVGNYFSDRGGKLTSADLGRFSVTGKEHDRHIFKVPSLRLAALQKFFFHDASATTLVDAIQIMGRYQLGRDIPDNDATAIKAFLLSLVGKHPHLKRP